MVGNLQHLSNFLFLSPSSVFSLVCQILSSAVRKMTDDAISVYARSKEYMFFRNQVAFQRVTVGNINEKVWQYYDFGPRDVAPLVCIPGASGTADVFYKQIVSLTPKGIRVIAVQPPPYETHQGWCKGFDRFLDKINITKVHLFGTSLGGYLAQCYCKLRPSRVESLILNNSFCDTQYFHDSAPCAAMFSMMPEFMLKRYILSNFPRTNLEPEIANSVDFMVEKLESLTQPELASRLTLNCALGPLKPGDVTLHPERITIIDTIDDNALPNNLREEVYKFYPEARVADIKTGGDFPYLSRADEVNMHIQIHLRKLGIPKPVVNNDS
eukprot:TRINITY_DN2067_c0_g1_i1.p1 TRINITY_DN2067_c0_g1~~TRINITY_DN2067_c0_g1_i1.p1  ORF type:complete len:326 (+),score=59.18 TRINITY_DN2067_c0_g1_i1:195-1172(+)